MLALNLALAGAPAVALFILASHREHRRGRSARAPSVALAWGVAAIAAALLAGVAVTPLRGGLPGAWRTVFDAFVVAGLVEETAKYVAVLVVLRSTVLRSTGTAAQTRDALVYGMVAGVGFAFVENTIYLGEPPPVMILRAVTAVPLHACTGAWLGFAVRLGRRAGSRAGPVGLAIAVVVHGVYDLMIAFGPPAAYASLALVVLAFAVTVHLYRVAPHDA